MRRFPRAHSRKQGSDHRREAIRRIETVMRERAEASDRAFQEQLEHWGEAGATASGSSKGEQGSGAESKSRTTGG